MVSASPKTADLVTVCRHWRDTQKAQVHIDKLTSLRFDSVAGGAGVMAPRQFLHGCILCTDLVSGEIAHSGRRGPPPHEIIVCITKKDNSPEIYKRLLEKSEWMEIL